MSPCAVPSVAALGSTPCDADTAADCTHTCTNIHTNIHTKIIIHHTHHIQPMPRPPVTPTQSMCMSWATECPFSTPCHTHQLATPTHSMCMSWATEWPSSTMIFFVQCTSVALASSMRTGTTGVRMFSACLTIPRASTACAFNRLQGGGAGHVIHVLRAGEGGAGHVTEDFTLIGHFVFPWQLPYPSKRGYFGKMASNSEQYMTISTHG